ncbi:MAG: Re/Si-specific NAD(P)(+) transhydrogenase subunit alpha [Thermoguttaceae bacterium]
MIVAVPQETFPGEKRVALAPAAIAGLIKGGLEVRIQSGAGRAAGFPDEAYSQKGAVIAPSREEVFLADALLHVRVPGRAGAGTDLSLYRPGQVVVGLTDVLSDPESARPMASCGVSLFALEMVPRITRAQAMDVLSSQATVAGYRAVLLASLALSRMFPMLITAAGTLHAAKVLVVGAGVAGLQAIATARRLGAMVSAYDVRAAVKEQVQSLGAKFVEMPLDPGQAEGRGGYAQEMGEEFYRRQRELMARVVAESDVVITTAAVPGKKAPVLVTAEMVAQMSAGSVLVDVAAERGGNCELTRPGETLVAHGVTILGPIDLPGQIPHDASQLYAKNIATFLQYLVKDGRVRFDMDDEIIRETLITRDGKVVHPKIAALLEPQGA